MHAVENTDPVFIVANAFIDWLVCVTLPVSPRIGMLHRSGSPTHGYAQELLIRDVRCVWDVNDQIVEAFPCESETLRKLRLHVRDLNVNAQSSAVLTSKYGESL